MAENKTFAEQRVTEPELSESDRIRQRIQDYKAQLSPNTLQVIQIMLEAQLKSGLMKPADLDALVMLRDEVNKAQIEYNTQVQNAQRRLQDLSETEMAEKVAAEEAKIQAIVDSRDAERARRKGVEDRLAQMKSAAPNMGRLKIKEFPTKRLTVTGLRAYLNQLRNYEDFQPEIIVIDYLELMTNQDVSMSEYMAQERIAQELRGIAVEHKCLVWTATQTNRKGKEVDIITDAELADSYGKIRVCDLAFSINQKEQEFDEGKARMFVMKSRNGRARYIVPIRIDYTRLTVTQQ